MKTRSYKCILSCILAVTLLFCMIPLVNISATTKDYLTGDANSDGIINVRDATQIQKAIASIIILDETQNLAADTDGNSEVNIKDATAIQKFVAGIETGLPFENIKPSVNPNVKKDTKNKIGYQLKMPQNGDIIAILHTSMGDITLRFFPENAPKAVENFIALAKDGKYDNTIFHRVIDDFVIQGGDFENGNGTGGVSSFGKPFEDEFCDTLYNIRGAVSMANAGKNTNGSQFFINQTKPESFSRSLYDYDKYYALYKEYYNSLIEAYGEDFTQFYPTLSKFIEEYIGGINPLSYAVPEEVWDLYEKNGGNIHLDGALRASGGHTVFAQVIEGMDVVDNIAGVNVNSNTNKPLEDVTILSVEITTYKAN